MPKNCVPSSLYLYRLVCVLAAMGRDVPLTRSLPWAFCLDVLVQPLVLLCLLHDLALVKHCGFLSLLAKSYWFS